MSVSDSLRAEEFDLDAWIDGTERPTVTVELYPRESEFRARVAKIEAQAERIADEPGNRGVNDPSPEVLAAQLEELRRERAASVLPVKVQQLTVAEVATVLKGYQETQQGDPDGTTDDMWIVAAACVEPKFTPQQLARLKARDRSGEQMFAQLMVAVAEIQRELPVPS